MARPRILLSSHPHLAAATVLWSRDGTPFATVIAKLELDAETCTVVAAAGRVESDDRFEGQNPLRPLLAVGETAPYLPQCDVVILGSAALEELSVTRGAEALLSKQGAASAFGPLPRIGPERKRMAPAGGGPQRDAYGAIVFSSALPWAYFQSAPTDQRIAHLTGGERLHLRAGTASRSIALPSLRAVARVWLEQQEVLVRLLCDMVIVDLHRGVVALVFRGLVALPPSSLTTIRAITTLQYADREPDWTQVVVVSPPSANDVDSVNTSTESTRTLAKDAPPPSLGAPFPIASRDSQVLRPAVASWSIPSEVTPASAAGDQTLGLPPTPSGRVESLSSTRFPDEESVPMAAPFRIAEPGSRAPIFSATPWAGAPLTPAPTTSGEETVALGQSSAPLHPPTGEAKHASYQQPLTSRASAPPSPSTPPRESLLRTPSPPIEKAPVLSPREQMEKRLRGSGASEADIAILLARLAPPAAPPPDDD